MSGQVPPPTIVGREEWLALPDLGIPAVLAKVDTGAQTSSLHAFSIHPFEDKGRHRLRFGIHPLPERPDIELVCTADLVARRTIVSSNGESELRFVIASTAVIGGRARPIEISLSDREGMRRRMLLGRQALEGSFLVDVTRSLIHGTPDLSVYDTLPHVRAAERPLRIALPGPAKPGETALRIAEAAGARGHRAVLLDIDRCYARIGGAGCAVHLDGVPLPAFDIVLPQIPPESLAHGLAIVRQFEALGTRCLPGAAALALARDRLHAAQTLARRSVALPPTGFAKALRDRARLLHLLGEPPARGTIHMSDIPMPVQRPGESAGKRRRRCLVIGRKLLASLAPASGGEGDDPALAPPRPARISIAERRLALAAVAALNLPVAAVELAGGPDRPVVLDVDPAPALAPFETASGINAAAAIVELVEKRAGTRQRRA